MKPKAKAYPGGKEAKIHNPTGRGVLLTLGQPGKKGNRMAKPKGKKKANTPKKKTGGSKSKTKNYSAAEGSSSKAKAKKTNPTTKKKSAKKHNGALSKLTNPLPALANVSLAEWGVFALAAISSPGIASLLATPGGWLNIGIQFGLTGLATFAPKGVRTAAVYGAGGPAVVTLFNKITNNFIPKFIQTNIGPIIPIGLLGDGGAAAAQQAAAAAAAQNNMAGLRRMGMGAGGYPYNRVMQQSPGIRY